MNYTFIENGSVTSPLGFVAGGVCAGVKAATSAAITKAVKANESAVIPNGKRDLAMIYCEKPCAAAAIFTKNLVKSDTIYVTQEHLRNGTAQAVIVNSGNANACNPDGREKAERMCALAAEALHIAEDDVIVASTGVIGQPLPLAPIQSGVAALRDKLSKEGGTDAAEAIMTTDTVKKEWAVQLTLDGKTVTIGGIAKGSGMIHINMGTTLSFVTTDAAISAAMLREALVEAADVTYNMVSVDGDTSTNDTLAIMASGLAGNTPITGKDAAYRAFTEALTAAFRQVARKLAADGEGATKLLTCQVSGAKDEQAAKTIAKSVICSSLVKAAMFGADANCGRILCAVGYSGAEVDVRNIDVAYRSAKGEILVCQGGMGLAFDEAKAEQILLEDEINILITLGDGSATAEAFGCDLTYDYVKINGDYRT
ncbi:MAG: bifunctional glutamate N-acetyltransferase/amino-acid acetyltransferase ArgJ [Ruminococcus sp.]|nr:bifunctional glutamate N-acetyltransferase/amino-acid acetyltransferase ArgJ [Ruminococcus sp.]